MGAGLILILFIVLGLMIWVFVVISRGYEIGFHRVEPPQPRDDRTGGFPVTALPALTVREGEDGPGRYRVVGVVRATGADTKMYVEAMSLANAKVKAELMGVIVTEIVKD
jgi:hypothetical protein